MLAKLDVLKIQSTIEMIVLFIILSIAQYSAFSIDISHVWNAYRGIYIKSRTLVDSKFKIKSFQDDAAFVVTHNIEADLGLRSSWSGINQWSHLNESERKATLSCAKPMPDDSRKDGGLKFNYTIGNYPDEFDSRKLNLVTPMKDQGSCGSCWAFSAVGALEGQWAKIHKNLVSLSEQNALDCSSKDDCNGGLPMHVYSYVKRNHGIDTEESYPYEGVRKRCRFRRDDVGATCRSYMRLPSGDENALKAGVYDNGPVSIAFDASTEDFKTYKGGILDPAGCQSINHVMVLVGYGIEKESGKRYWIVKNSYGTKWGEKGYARVIAGKDACFISAESIIPIV